MKDNFLLTFRSPLNISNPEYSDDFEECIQRVPQGGEESVTGAGALSSLPPQDTWCLASKEQNKKFLSDE